jgi:hypothetical protein
MLWSHPEVGSLRKQRFLMNEGEKDKKSRTGDLFINRSVRELGPLATADLIEGLSSYP